MATKAAAKIIDFGNVKDKGNFNPKHIESGDYEATIKAVELVEAKDGEDMWLFTFVLSDVPRATYPYYCKLVDNQFWKIKQLFEAVGVNVGKRKVKVDPNRVVGKKVGVYMEDDEYEGRMKSVVQEVLPLDQLTGAVTGEDDDDEVGAEEDDIEEEEAPKKKRRPEPEPEEDEEDEDLEEDEEEEEPEPPRKRAAKKAPAKKAPAKRRRPVDDEDEEDDEELEIDEL